MIEVLIIILLFAFLVYQEITHKKHIKELEDRLMAHNLTDYYQNKPVASDKRVHETNTIMADGATEAMLGDIPFMSIPKDFKIQREEDATTPFEARARGEEQ